MGIDSIIPDQCLRKIRPHEIAKDHSLHFTPKVPKRPLKGAEIVDLWNPIPTPLTALGTGPGPVPFNGPINFPVGEYEIHIHTRRPDTPLKS